MLTLIDVYHMLASRLMDIGNLASPPTVVFQFQAQNHNTSDAFFKKNKTKKKLHTYKPMHLKCALMMQRRWSFQIGLN